MRNKILQIEKLINKNEIKVISVDVFDTLLLRTTQPELMRFKDFSQEQYKQITLDNSVTRDELYFARLKVGRELFSKAKREGGCYEVTYKEWMKTVLQGGREGRVDDKIVQHCLDIELALEQQMLKLNKSLWLYLETLRSRGHKIVLCSDMYLGAKSINYLLRSFVGADLPYTTFVSSEWQKTKRAGSLYRAMMLELEVEAENVLHIGDNWISDILVPSNLGIHTIHTPRSFSWGIVHRIRAFFYRFYVNYKAQI
ncbi:HAD family hydrolase [Kiloniella sp.]|uniref:HAD family hydrolase n=1 Tax=Kiloniella sp. TaxID=1938587 RepID=UPI003A926E4F